MRQAGKRAKRGWKMFNFTFVAFDGVGLKEFTQGLILSPCLAIPFHNYHLHDVIQI